MADQLIHPDALAYVGWDMTVPLRPSDFCTFPSLAMRTVLYLGLTWPYGRTMRQIARACHIPKGTAYNTLLRLARAGVLVSHRLPGYKYTQCYTLCVAQEDSSYAPH